MAQASKILIEDGINFRKNDLISFLLKTDKYGKERMIPVTRVTGKGLIFLNKKLREWLGLEKLDVEI